MINALYEKASLLHGHKCPGLAIGVRAAAEAMSILAVNDECIRSKEFYCVAEKNACYTDGIQALSGCTIGNGHLIIRYTGKTAFSFYNGLTGKSIRLVMKHADGDTKDEKTRFILTAPLEQVFTKGPVRYPSPVRDPSPELSTCPCCGEETDITAMVSSGDVLLCSDCAAGR